MRVGLIVNPVAGMGGAVGLKGTDGAETLTAAVRMGALPRASGRAALALAVLVRSGEAFEILVAPGPMGERAARDAGLVPVVVGSTSGVSVSAEAGPTSAEDTRRAARDLLDERVELLLFAGGDGTARDILDAVGEGPTVLGIPAGVKVHSACFGTSPRAAGELALRFLTGEDRTVREAEVMDVDEDALRGGAVSARLHGYLRVPFAERLVQGPKARSRSEAGDLSAIAQEVVRRMDPETLYVVGPGTTARAVLSALGTEGTLAGVDVVRRSRLLAADVNEATLLNLLAPGPPAVVIVAPIGGQGYVFGRGNQQISARVLAAVGPRNVLVVATAAKLASLGGRPLLVDTDDAEMDRRLAGFARVITGAGEEAVYPVAQP
ncbi:MAG TPA: ATP-NAD kinase family protein [Actinomycetota bacterium]|nr:ATP-NAD kinase family protein [Actinomycetota bacterium]